MEDFFGVPPRIYTISSVDPNLSSYWTEIGWDGGRISKKILYDLLCNHKFFVPYLALYTISIHYSIGEKLLYDLWVDNPNRVQ